MCLRLLMLAVFTLSISCGLLASDLPDATWDHLPRWRGFNLLEKFNVSTAKPFLEEDFQMISELGFNFVRLPMDYRSWIKDSNWRSFDENTFSEIDQAVEWGRRYKIHVCINFHRAPGYTVAKPAESKSLWTDPEALDVCALHWAIFAKRYKGIPNRNLSFNLLNEPSDIDAKTYYRVVSKLVDAIRKEDPERLIIADGLKWGNVPCPDLIPLKVPQATRGYTPAGVTHYMAPWMGAHFMRIPLPQWPSNCASAFLYGPNKAELKRSFVFNFAKPLDVPLELSLEVGTVSDSSLLVVSADGRRIFSKPFKCGPGEGEWSQAVYAKEWDIYQNIYGKEYKCGTVPPGTRCVEIENAEGDWMTFNKLSFDWKTKDAQPCHATLAPGIINYGSKQESPILFDPFSRDVAKGESPFVLPIATGRAWLFHECVEPWKELEGRGCGVFVGEFGCFNKTPHATALAWMEDSLKNWKEAGWGWDLWNFRGSFGILDSGRADVSYEDWRGHKLDRQMLELLQRY